MPTKSLSAAEMERRVARFNKLATYQQQNLDTHQIPPGAMEKVTARRVYPVMTPPDYQGRSAGAPIKGPRGLIVSIASRPLASARGTRMAGRRVHRAGLLDPASTRHTMGARQAGDAWANSNSDHNAGAIALTAPATAYYREAARDNAQPQSTPLPRLLSPGVGQPADSSGNRTRDLRPGTQARLGQ